MAVEAMAKYWGVHDCLPTYDVGKLVHLWPELRESSRTIILGASFATGPQNWLLSANESVRGFSRAMRTQIMRGPGRGCSVGRSCVF